MNCRYFHEHLAELIAGELSPEEAQTFEQHAATCSACAAARREARAALAAVTPHAAIAAPATLAARILEAAARRTDNADANGGATQPDGFETPYGSFSRGVHRIGSVIRRRALRLATGIASAAAVVALIVSLGIQTPARAARNCFGDAATAMSGTKSLRMELRIRTNPQENFAYTDPRAEEIGHTIEVVYTPARMWRIEKPGRKALYDGERTYQWLASGSGWFCDGEAPGILEFLALLLDPQSLMRREQEFAATARGANYTIVHDNDAIRLTAASPAQGEYSQSDIMRNTSVFESDTRREYRFDPQTRRLTAARITGLFDGAERTLLEIVRIDYDAPIDTAALAARPDGIEWLDMAPRTAGPQLVGIGPKQAAERILAAMGVWNTELTDEAFRYYGSEIRSIIRDRFEGARIVAIGEPVRSGQYPGWFVAAELQMRDGTALQLTLALRNDNADGAWLVDGGI